MDNTLYERLVDGYIECPKAERRGFLRVVCDILGVDRREFIDYVHSVRMSLDPMYFRDCLIADYMLAHEMNGTVADVLDDELHTWLLAMCYRHFGQERSQPVLDDIVVARERRKRREVLSER